ncbi:MAG: glycosyltransferase family protein [Waterburya sp.]
MRLNINQFDDPGHRVLVWSQRNIENFIFNSCLFEFEDIIKEVDLANIISPPQYSLGEKIVRKFVKNNTQYCKSLVNLNPYFQSIYLEQEYDVFLTILDFPQNLSSINLLKNWRKKCQFSVCYLIEIWHKDLPRLKNFIRFFQDFDLVCLGHSEIVDDVQKIIDRPCIYLPPGVNAIKFCPDSQTSDWRSQGEAHRSIDLLTLGRRSEVVHQALLELAEQTDFFYYYDYISGARQRSDRHQEHRTLIANLLKSSRYFITNYAKVNKLQETHGQQEIGYRFFEGAAAGSVLLGCPPDNLAFKHYFDWDNAIIPIDFDERNIAKIIAELDSQPELLKQIRTDNVVNSLLKHDWVYRWEQVLRKLGMSLTPGIKKRQDKLKELAQTYTKR